MGSDYFENKLDKLLNEIVGKCFVCKNGVKRVESNDCETCEKLYCMQCVKLDENNDDSSIIVTCPLNHLIAIAFERENKPDGMFKQLIKKIKKGFS